MKPEIKSRWTAELRSGRFEQGMGALRDGDQYCCLGVLCELAAEAGVIPRGHQRSDGLYDYDDEDGLPSEKVAEWAGFELEANGEVSRNPHFHHGEGEDRYLTSLADENDADVPFDEIADLIDKHL